MTLFHLKFGRILDYPSKGLVFEVLQSGIEHKCKGVSSRYLNKVFTFTINQGEPIEIIAKTKKMCSHPVPFSSLFIPSNFIRPGTVLHDWFIFRRENNSPMIVELFVHNNISQNEPFSSLPLQIVSEVGYLVPDSAFVCRTYSRPIYDREYYDNYSYVPETLQFQNQYFVD
jgi:hypothetical protein